MKQPEKHEDVVPVGEPDPVAATTTEGQLAGAHEVVPNDKKDTLKKGKLDDCELGLQTDDTNKVKHNKKECSVVIQNDTVLLHSSDVENVLQTEKKLLMQWS